MGTLDPSNLGLYQFNTTKSYQHANWSQVGPEFHIEVFTSKVVRPVSYAALLALSWASSTWFLGGMVYGLLCHVPVLYFMGFTTCCGQSDNVEFQESFACFLGVSRPSRPLASVSICFKGFKGKSEL